MAEESCSRPKKGLLLDDITGSGSHSSSVAVTKPTSQSPVFKSSSLLPMGQSSSPSRSEPNFQHYSHKTSNASPEDFTSVNTPQDDTDHIAQEIVVRTDDLDTDMPESTDQGSPQGSSEPIASLEASAMATPIAATVHPSSGSEPQSAVRASLTSSMSVLSETSELSSIPTSESSKATTPFEADSSREAPVSIPASITTRRPLFPKSPTPKRRFDVRPKLSIPNDMNMPDYAQQCVAAAENSRLNPYGLHEGEYSMLREHITHSQVTTYLNIRNGILRLWVKNPQVAVSREEAIGCAKDKRWFDVANVCFEWLVRNSYINFGCVRVRTLKKITTPPTTGTTTDQPKKRKRVVAVIGAGMSGLGCARQLDNLFKQYAKRFRSAGEDPPEVVVLEGRGRIGGRVYSRQFRFQADPDDRQPAFTNHRSTAEMGGMIVTGFERGNPMNILVRGQLNLGYHALVPDTNLYDSDGKPVDLDRDKLTEKLYNDCLDCVSRYKYKQPASKLIEGNPQLIDDGRDSSSEGQKTIAMAEESTAALPNMPPVAEQNVTTQVDMVPVSSDRVTGRAHFEPGIPGAKVIASSARNHGWDLKDGVPKDQDIDIDPASKEEGATLGSVLDDAIRQYGDIVRLTPQDYRLINWHVANLEYSNACNLRQLSLQCWDLDMGNEWEGSHSMIVGGYQRVPRGLLAHPSPLELRRKAPVSKITYSPEYANQPSAKIECEDGTTIDADFVVSTIPLGVLKKGSVEFEPALPKWKSEAIQRLGFGVLNKVVLLYKKPFWDEERDIFGILRDPEDATSLDQKAYNSTRGRMFQWFNVTKTTGLPCLIGLMAGDAAYDAEKSTDEGITAEATEVLRSVYGPLVPEPLESIVTRWASDRFAYGSYSNAGPSMRPDDYDVMARPLGNLFFAGEHTTGSYPATVHGAYITGLRAATEVLDAMLGPIDVPIPLILPRDSAAGGKRKSQEFEDDPRQARLDAYEQEIISHLISNLGLRPLPPPKSAINAYSLFSKAKFTEAKAHCDANRPKNRKPPPNEVRAAISKMWKVCPAEERREFVERADELKKTCAEILKTYEEKATEWDLKAIDLRTAYEKEHPSVPGPNEAPAAERPAGHPRRRAKRLRSYVETEDDDLEG